MADLRERFRALDQVDTPDVWPRVGELGPKPPSPSQPTIARRLGIIALSFAVAVAGIGLVVRALGTTPRPVVPRPPSEPVLLSVDVGDPIPVGAYPNAVAVGEGAVWVSVRDAGSEGGQILRLDPRSGDIEARIQMEILPGWEFGGGGIAAGAGRLWVSGRRSQSEGGCCEATIVAIDPVSNSIVREVPFGLGSGADVWVDGDDVWVLTFTEGNGSMRLLRVNATTYDVMATIELPTTWAQQVFTSGGSVWVHGTKPDARGPVEVNTLYRVDPERNELVDVISFDIQSFPLAADDVAIWHREIGGIARVDPAGGGLFVDVPTQGEDCCGRIASDGSGGVWFFDRGTPERGIVIHLGPDGAILAESAEAISPVEGVASDLDLETLTFWIVQYEHTVTPVRIRLG